MAGVWYRFDGHGGFVDFEFERLAGIRTDLRGLEKEPAQSGVHWRMTRKRRRFFIVSGFLLTFSIAAALVLMAFEENIVFFYSPTELSRKLEQQLIPPNRRLRIGGLVEDGSVGREDDGLTITFRVTDTVEVVPVRFRGLLPDLFREGQGVVAEGNMGSDGTFIATEVLAKHDETYMPKEVAEALKEAGQWQGDRK